MTADAADADLIAAVRAGDLAAYGDLFVRHRDAAARLARQLVPGPDADDLVAEAFARVMAGLQQGKGPDEFFRAYLLTSIRHLHIDRIRAGKRVRTTADEAELDRAIEFVDPAELKFEQRAAAQAFASLPERWQLVLWHLDVERQKPAQVAPLLGMTPNSVSALAYRAREGLRAAYLQSHLAPALDDGCRTTTALLSQHVRQTLRGRDTAAVDAHLDTCTRCTGLYLELLEINGNLSGWLAPALLGVAATGYLGVAGTAAGTGMLAHTMAAISGRTQSVTAAGPLATGAVVAAATLTVVGAVAGINLIVGDGDPPPTVSTQPAAESARRAPAPPAESKGPRATREASEPAATPLPPTPIVQTRPSTVVPGLAPAPDEPTTPGRKRTPALDPATMPTPQPTQPSPSPTPEPLTSIDYSVTVGFNDEQQALQRRVTVGVFATGGPVRGQILSVQLAFGTTLGLPAYRGGLTDGWFCNAPPVGQQLAAMTCTRPHTSSDVPPLEFSIEGPNPYVDATVNAADNVDPSPTNDHVLAEAPPWVQP